MRFIIIFFTAICFTIVSFGQEYKSQLFKAYKKNSTKRLQKFIDTWVKEAAFQIDSNQIFKNDTLKNVYDVLNSFYRPVYPATKCILMQPNLQYVIVDNLDKDTLLKRAIFKVFRKRADSIYKKAINNPGTYDYLIDEFYDGVYITSGSIRISTQYLNFKDKKILPLTDKYKSIILDFIWNSKSLNRIEEIKRLNFLRGQIEFFRGMGGYLKINNAPSNIIITLDSTFKNAEVSCRGNTGGGTSLWTKKDGKWVVLIESLGRTIE